MITLFGKNMARTVDSARPCRKPRDTEGKDSPPRVEINTDARFVPPPQCGPFFDTFSVPPHRAIGRKLTRSVCDVADGHRTNSNFYGGCRTMNNERCTIYLYIGLVEGNMPLVPDGNYAELPKRVWKCINKIVCIIIDVNKF